MPRLGLTPFEKPREVCQCIFSMHECSFFIKFLHWIYQSNYLPPVYFSDDPSLRQKYSFERDKVHKNNNLAREESVDQALSALPLACESNVALISLCHRANRRYNSSRFTNSTSQPTPAQLRLRIR